MFFSSTETRTRIRQFERLQRIAAETLQRPGVRQRLGQLGMRMADLNHTAFLPNVHHAVVSVPRRLQDTDRIALLPYLPGDANLRPDHTFLQPPPERRARIKQQMGAAGLDSTHRMVTAFIQRGVANLSEDERVQSVNPRTGARAAAATYIDKKTGIMVAGRPVVIFNVEQMAGTPHYQANALSHELVHIDDMQLLETKQGPMFSPWTELRAYHAGAIVEEEAIASGHLTRQQMLQEDPVTLRIDGLRRRYGIDGAALLNGGLQSADMDGGAAEELQALGVA